MEQLDRQGRLLFPKSPTGRIRLRYWLDEMVGTPVSNLWDDIPSLAGSHAERLGYPTQKPVALLERIVRASSSEGGVVLDPFCGCGTAIAAAQKLGRRWIGIDITHLAVALIRSRLASMFGGEAEFTEVGVPQDLASAQALAQQDRYQFQAWALSRIPAFPSQAKKGADGGLDGIVSFVDSADRKAKRAVVQVKSGHVDVRVIRELCDVVRTRKAAMGLLVTLEPPSQPMLTEALASGYYHSPGWNRDYQRIQVRTVEQLLAGQEFDMPPTNVTFEQAARFEESAGQSTLW